MDINPLTGNGDFRFRLNGGTWRTPEPVDATTYTFTGLANGSYTIDVIDGFGCTAQLPVKLSPQLIVSVDVLAVSACADGSISVNATGGNGTLVYAIVPAGSDPTGSFTTNNTLTITNAMATANPAGYDVYVRDNNGGVDFLCFFEQKDIILTPAISLELAVDPTDPECFDGLGSIDAAITGGRAPFTYTLVDLSSGDGIDYGVSYSNVSDLSYVFTGVGVGNYEITITDADNCSIPAVSATINNAVEITADIAPILPNDCVGSSITDYGFEFDNLVTPTGTVEYSFDGGATWNTGNEQRGIASGTSVYPSIRVTLASGTICQKDFPRYIIPYPLDDLDISISAIVVDCNDLQVTVQGTAGIAPYEYAYSEDPANFNQGTATWIPGSDIHIVSGAPTTVTPGHGNHVWTGLIPGRTYVFYVRDATGCVRQSLQNVNNLVTIPIDIITEVTPSCFNATPGLGNGEIIFTLNPTIPSTQMRWEVFQLGNPTPIQVSGGGASAINVPYNNTITASGLAEGEYYIEVIQTDGTTDTCTGGSENALVEELKELDATATATRDISCNLPGLISITGITGGGGAPYTFDVTGPTGFTALTDLTSNPVQIPINSPAGEYTVTLNDQYGCPVILDPVTLDLSPNPTIDQVEQNNCSAPISLNVTANSLAGNIRYALVASGNPAPASTAYLDNAGIFNNVAPGTYDVYVMDGNGCIATRPDYIIDPVLSAKAELSKPLDCTASPNAEIIIEALSGSGDYDYSITNTAGVPAVVKTSLTSPFVYKASAPGDYTITVYDNATPDSAACNREFTVTVSPVELPKFIETHIDVSCNGGTDGSITLLETINGTNPLVYQLHYATAGNPLVDVADFTYDAATKTYSELAPGEYMVRGIGKNECFTDVLVTIRQPNPIMITALNVVEYACTVDTNTSNHASITVTTVTGGSGNYTYEFVNNQGTLLDTTDDVVVKARSTNATYTETNRVGGSYTINVYDGNNCVGSTTVPIDILPYLEMTDLTLTPIDPSCIPGADGTIGVVLGLNGPLGTTDIQYEIDGLDVVYHATHTGNVAAHTFTGLGIGNYQITATNLATGCVVREIAELKDPNTFEVHIDATTDVICYGTDTGTATFSVTDITYAGDYTWEVYNSADDTLVDNGNLSARQTTIGLGAGDYYVTFTQVGVPVCDNKKPFSIAGPDAALAATRVATAITCAPGNDGVIEITATGGWGGYRYYVSTTPNPDPNNPANYVTTPKFENLSVGTYEVRVIDSNGCPWRLSDVVLDRPDPIIADLRINDHNCSNFEGEIEVVGIPATDPIRGGQGSNYSYQLQILNGGVFVNLRNKQTTPIFSGLGAGRYQVIVSDQWGCIGDPTAAIELYDVMVPKAEVVKLIDCMFNNEAGQITITQTGGVGPFAYTGTFPDGSALTPNSDGVFTGLDQVGEYTFTITDAVGCSEEIKRTLNAPIQPPTPIINAFTNVSCFGAADGTISVSVPNNGLDPYTFQITHKDGSVANIPPTSTTNTSAKFTGLQDGLYTITVTAANGCTMTVTQSITQPAAALAVDTPVISEFGCTVGNTTDYATIDVSGLVTGGSGNYVRYVFTNTDTGRVVQDGPSAKYTETNLAGGNYTVTVYDDMGCIDIETATIAPFVGISNPVVSLANAGVSCIGNEDIQVSVTTTLGSPTAAFNLEYAITSTNTTYTAPNNSTGSYTGLGVGNYIITVTNLTTGCFVKTTHEVKEPKVIQAIATKLTDENCLNDGNPDGSFSVAINNYSGDYDYQVFRDGSPFGTLQSGNTGTPLVINNLPGGVYYVLITGTDHPFCPDDSNRVTINAPEAPISAVVTEESNVSCDNDSGSILVTPADGKGPYTITIDDGAGQRATQTVHGAYLFSGLSAGAFTITVTDSFGCLYTHNAVIDLVRPAPIVANISPDVTLECYGDTDGEVFATIVSGGFGTPKYQLNVWDPTGTVIMNTSAPQWGSPNSHRFTNLPAGIYSISITDEANCGTETAKTQILDPSDVVGSLVRTQALGCNRDAELLLTASGGTGPYEYSVDGITYLPMSGGNTHTFAVTAGTYRYYVRDQFGCGNVLSNEIKETAIVPLTVELDMSAAMINCNGDHTAILIAKANGGLGNYSYELFTDAALTNSIAGPQTSGRFNNLVAGEYYVRVISDDCTVVSNVARITEPTPITVTSDQTEVSCNGANDGSITVNMTGGSGGYQYAISPRLDKFDTVNIFTGLAPGNYTVIAQDKNGCFEKLDFTIRQPEILMATAERTPEICIGSEDGTIDVTITGGTAPYSTSINSLEDADFVEGRVHFSDLAAGTYAIFVRDAEGCETYATAVIDSGVNLNATAAPVYECTGDTPNNSIVLVLEDGAIATDVMYALDSTDPNDMVLEPNFANLAPGNHFITIAHANGCENRIDFTVADFEPLVLFLDQKSLNQITAMATGGQGKYTYYFGDVNNGTDNTYYINKTGTYTVRVVDENGCEAVADIYMEFVDIEIPNFFTPNGDGGNDTWKPKNQEGFPKILTIIFDRYGREVYRMGLNDGGWDGIYKGNELPTGDYWYVIKLKGEHDDREFVGHFTLYR